MMQLADGSKIELFEYSCPEISRVSPQEDDAAETHIAPKAIDIDHSIAVLRERKLRMLNDPGTLSDGERWFYFLIPGLPAGTCIPARIEVADDCQENAPFEDI
jgi:hypothetical protein